jgi:hypothetical protein
MKIKEYEIVDVNAYFNSKSAHFCNEHEIKRKSNFSIITIIIYFKKSMK